MKHEQASPTEVYLPAAGGAGIIVEHRNCRCEHELLLLGRLQPQPEACMHRMYNRKPTNRPKQSVGTQEATWSSGSLTTRVSVIVNCGSSLIFCLELLLEI